jgi:hypothetical protein
MHQIRLLRVIFEGELMPFELPAFRGAVARKAGLENELFHNHQGDSFRYAYPLIQYKTHGKKPMLLCLGEGVEEAHKFFEKRDWSLPISGRQLDMKIETLELRSYGLRVEDRPYHYRLRQWIALNQENHREYHALGSEEARRAFLARKLTGNLLSFAKGAGWHVEGTLDVRILELPPPRMVRIKDVQVHSFQPLFSANVALPEHIGLGGKVSLGFGTLYHARPYPSQSPDA